MSQPSACQAHNPLDKTNRPTYTAPNKNANSNQPAQAQVTFGWREY
ncbi:hypothetical protein QUF58_08630 [Anaerolineales bacterium HSG24]|nr:hypothetical protein [Anaerolineales bacterium HSG24]